MIGDFEELRTRARGRRRARVAVVGAESATALAAVLRAAAEGFAEPVLVGNEDRIRGMAQERGFDLTGADWVPADTHEKAAECAAALAGAGEVDVLLKGNLRTDQLLRAVLDRRHGLRTQRLLSDVFLYEDVLSGAKRLVGGSDGGINPAPDAAALKQIVANAVELFHTLGWERPRVALLSATEAVTPSVPSTVVARCIQEEADELGVCDVSGPLALDNALLARAARAKGISGAVAGHADILIVPNIEAGNILGKAVKYFGGSILAHVVVGARVPVLIPSRVESEADKLHSIALGVLAAGELTA